MICHSVLLMFMSVILKSYTLAQQLCQYSPDSQYQNQKWGQAAKSVCLYQFPKNLVLVSQTQAKFLIKCFFSYLSNDMLHIALFQHTDFQSIFTLVHYKTAAWSLTSVTEITGLTYHRWTLLSTNALQSATAGFTMLS